MTKACTAQGAPTGIRPAFIVVGTNRGTKYFCEEKHTRRRFRVVQGQVLFDFRLLLRWKNQAGTKWCLIVHHLYVVVMLVVDIGSVKSRFEPHRVAAGREAHEVPRAKHRPRGNFVERCMCCTMCLLYKGRAAPSDTGNHFFFRSLSACLVCMQL